MNSYKTKTKIDFKALKYVNLYLMKVKRKSYLIFGILCAACVFGAAYSFITGGMDNLLFAIIFALFAVYAVYSMITFEKKIDKSLLKYFATNAPITQYIALDENNVSICLKGQDKLEKVSYDWAYVNEVNVLNDYYIMFLAGGMPVIIDRNPESVLEGTMEEIDELIKSKCEMKPYKVYTKELVRNFVDPVTYIESPEDDIEAIIEKLNEAVVEPVTEPQLGDQEMLEAETIEEEVSEELEESTEEAEKVTEEKEESTEETKEENSQE